MADRGDSGPRRTSSRASNPQWVREVVNSYRQILHETDGLSENQAQKEAKHLQVLVATDPAQLTESEFRQRMESQLALWREERKTNTPETQLAQMAGGLKELEAFLSSGTVSSERDQASLQDLISKIQTAVATSTGLTKPTQKDRASITSLYRIYHGFREQMLGAAPLNLPDQPRPPPRAPSKPPPPPMQTRQPPPVSAPPPPPGRPGAAPPPDAQIRNLFGGVKQDCGVLYASAHAQNV